MLQKEDKQQVFLFLLRAFVSWWLNCYKDVEI